MKTLIATLLLCIWGDTFAVLEKPLPVSEQIRRKVEFADYAAKHKMEGYVHVTYKIDELHRIQIDRINGSTRELVNYVKSKIAEQEVYGQDLTLNELLTITFTYCPSGRNKKVSSGRKESISHS